MDIKQMTENCYRPGSLSSQSIARDAVALAI